MSSGDRLLEVMKTGDVLASEKIAKISELSTKEFLRVACEADQPGMTRMLVANGFVSPESVLPSQVEASAVVSKELMVLGMPTAGADNGFIDDAISDIRAECLALSISLNIIKESPLSYELYSKSLASYPSGMDMLKQAYAMGSQMLNDEFVLL